MEYFFEEDQQFRQWWVWIILLPILIFSLATINFLSFSLIVLVVLLMYFGKLRLKVSAKGIHYQFFPFHIKSYCISFDDIKTVKAITYSPLKEYGGWGIRYRLHGKAYNVSGNKGIQLELNNEKKILFGSQRAEEFESVLENFIKA